MQKITLASGNQHKLLEIQAILKDFSYELISMHDAGLVDFEIIEDGKTFEENSYIKAKAVQDKVGGIVIADDSGLEVDFLDGAPGVYSARYSGEGANDQKNNEKLLDALKNTDDPQRGANFVAVITMLFPDGKKIVCRGDVKGRILRDKIGQGGFGYDPLFFVEEKNKTYAQLSSEEKNDISHRAMALKMLKKELEK